MEDTSAIYRLADGGGVKCHVTSLLDFIYISFNASMAIFWDVMLHY
jgi:hypothetical protein